MKYYCIGIKGSGMSALACILSDLGNTVCGYDDDSGYKYTMDGLIDRNISIYSDSNHLLDKDTIVTYSKAFSMDHPEMKKCHEMGLEFIEYFDLMGELSKKFKTIGVCGTHGKTTTTSLIKTVLDGKCNYFIGDGTGYADQKNEIMVMESCEYNKHFLHYYPSIVVITNIEREHMECYKDMNDVLDSFSCFANRAKVVFGCGDDDNVRALNIKSDVIYFGLKENNDVYASNIVKDVNGNSFDVYYKNNNIGRFFVPLYGDHMIIDTLACISVCIYLGCQYDKIVSLLKDFVNAKRRFKRETISDTVIIDDYAHHPTEIKNTLLSARQLYPDRKIIAVFRPNTYSRYHDYFDAFVDAFKQADYTFLTMVHSDRERYEDYNIDSNDIIDCLNGEIIGENLDSLLKYKGSVFCFMSCTDIYHLKDDFVKKLS